MQLIWATSGEQVQEENFMESALKMVSGGLSLDGLFTYKMADT